MKIGTLIRITSSNPQTDQDEINSLIGQTFEAMAHWKQKDSPLDKGEIQIKVNNDIYVLNSNEYELLP